MLSQLLKSESKKLQGGKKSDIKLHNSYTLIISNGMGSSSTATQKTIVRNQAPWILGGL